MNKLKSTLGKIEKDNKQQQYITNFSMKTLKSKTPNTSIWLLDNQNDMVQQKARHQNMIESSNLNQILKALVQKHFQNQKYLQQQTFQQMITQLTQYLQDIPTQLAKLTRIQETIIDISHTYIGQIKNYLKNFQSLLDVRIRKLKRKQKKIQLTEFQTIIHDKQLMKKRSEVFYIDQEKDQKKHIQRKQNRIKNSKISLTQSKKSYGTMNSGSNENQSSSGIKSGGSQSRSGQNNALAVLLNNKEHKRQQLKAVDKNQKSIDESYNFSAIMSNSVAVRQRSDRKQVATPKTIKQQNDITNSKIHKKDSAPDEKDQGFIFHRPKKSKKY